MLHIDWESRANQSALPEILERRRISGGKIVVFQRVVSFVFFTRLSNYYYLVGPYERRWLHGLMFFGPTFLTGWWSPSGFLYTCYALAHDLLGGVDVTEQISSPGTPRDRMKDISFARKRLALCVVIAATIFLPLLAWFTLTFMK